MGGVVVGRSSEQRYLKVKCGDVDMRMQPQHLTRAQPTQRSSGTKVGQSGRHLLTEEAIHFHGRQLADVAPMNDEDVDAMSPAELVLHRRRLADAALMAEQDVG